MTRNNNHRNRKRDLIISSETHSTSTVSDKSVDSNLGPKTKKTKKQSKNTTTSFAETMNKLLTATAEPHCQESPILSRSKDIERRINEAKLEYRARRAINMEKKKLASKDRVKTNLTSIDYERKLRKLATRGVVQLFNAIRKSQKVTDDAVKAAGGEIKLTTRDAKDVANMSKETFLDFLKGGE